MDKIGIDIHHRGESDCQDFKDATLDQSYLILLIHPLEIWNQLAESNDPSYLAGKLAGEEVPHLKAGNWSIFGVQFPRRLVRGWKSSRRGTLGAVMVIPCLQLKNKQLIMKEAETGLVAVSN